MTINFHPFQISVFYSFCHWFSIAFLKLYLVSFSGGGGGSLLVACVNWSLLTLLLFCIFIIVSQGCITNLYVNDGLLTRIINSLTARENDKTISSPSAQTSIVGR